MPILNQNPLEIPLIPAKVYPHLWLYNIIATSPTLRQGSIRIETLPCDMTTGEIANGEHMVPIQTDKLWQAVSEVPEVAAAMSAIFDAVIPLSKWIENQNSKSIPE